MQIQVAIVYFMTALLKASGKSWLDGTALYYALCNTEYCRFTLGLTESPLALNALTTGVLILEFALAFLLWFRTTRWFAIVAGAMLHAGIVLTINIPIFGELMVASYLTFLTAPELDGLLRVLNPRNWLPGRGRDAALALPPGWHDGIPEARGPHRERTGRAPVHASTDSADNAPATESAEWSNESVGW
jgi:hypothetical protein